MPPRRQPPPAAATLEMLEEQVAQRREELEKYDSAPSLSDSDIEEDSDSPVVDRFFSEEGNDAIHKMTNFTLVEFNGIWNIFKQHINSKYNTGRGSKSPIKEKDMLFMTIAVLKHGAKWDLMAYLFVIKSATFEKRASHMIKLLSGYAYERFALYYGRRYSKDRLLSDKTIFKTYKMCRYATDVTFQHSFRPGGTLEEVKKYFSGKHKLYGFKVDVSVLPNGLAICASKHYPGSTADIEIMCENLPFHDEALEKSPKEEAITDIDLLSEKFPDSWVSWLKRGTLELTRMSGQSCQRRSHLEACLAFQIAEKTKRNLPTGSSLKIILVDKESCGQLFRISLGGQKTAWIIFFVFALRLQIYISSGILSEMRMVLLMNDTGKDC